MSELPLSMTKQCRLNTVAGRQTQHREPIKPQPDTSHWKPEAFNKPKEWRPMVRLGPVHHGYDSRLWCLHNVGDSASAVPYICAKPKYKVGDKLWLQEPYQIMWAYNTTSDYEVQGKYSDDGKLFKKVLTQSEGIKFCKRKKPRMKTSGRFMYESLARHFFEVTGVKAERVQDISEEDAKAEGAIRMIGKTSNTVYSRPLGCPQKGSYYDGFCSLWDSCYDGGEFAWDKNPWVFAYTLRKVDYGRN